MEGGVGRERKLKERKLVDHTNSVYSVPQLTIRADFDRADPLSVASIRPHTVPEHHIQAA